MKSILKLLAEIGKVSIFTYRIIYSIFTSLPSINSIIEQMYKIGVRTLPVLSAVCIFVGITVTIVGYESFKQFGGQDFIGVFVALAAVRELSPMLVGAVMAAKPGTDISSTIATMKVKEQIDALEAMSIDPFSFLMAPRMIAFILVAPILVIFADFLCIASAYIVSVFQLGVNSGKYIDDLVANLEVMDFFKSIIKGEVSSFIVCCISCYFGYNSKPGPKGVSMAINKSVVLEASLIIIVNYFLTEIMYGIK